MTPHEAISFGLWAHQWEGIGAPSDECECCADVVLAALAKAGYSVLPTPLTSSPNTVTYRHPEDFPTQEPK